MRIRDYIILGLIMIWLVLVIIKRIKEKDFGSCALCSHRDSCAYKLEGKSCLAEQMPTKSGDE